MPELPEPRPLFEIFVYSPRVEGIHLRGGKVARGGLRWSDRREDFRTEILGLVKAQMVKNAVIVPVGSKGGFVLKAAPPAADREAYLREGIACYQDLPARAAGRHRQPGRAARSCRRATWSATIADDPYLVVAADKGTATFSDYRQRHFAPSTASGWAMRSPPAARPATTTRRWASRRAAPGRAVKRHFRELGIDTQTQDFTVAGVGDMSGDVFGNGMLLSRHIRLVAAFDHRHIFLDPNPDPATSFAERERLFALPRSSWDDYDKSLISMGGGVFPRSGQVDPAHRRKSQGARHRCRRA